ncbi:AI-2E family transporter [Ramlibacter monticola]|jgi:predicted PurR-regulated permease PerM|uniref:AI-2E family transporter n=1 Tax=Ramlibacter monticola TaxID=1926872 RepID=A0A936YZW1_9BURK|nr:AI-2E family transporter [Ramlibacter monticola]MBL0391015.1 AI-2E family transporter [Ramlibacter monticola]
MSSPNPLKNPNLEFKSLLLLVLAATLLFLLILWPFFGAICWAIFIAIVFWPMHQRFVQGSHGRRNMAALASLTVILLIVILPLAMVAASIAQEASLVVEKMRSGEIQFTEYFRRFIAALPEWARAVLHRFGMTDLAALQQRMMAAVGASGQVLTSRVVGLGQVTLDFIVAFFVMLYMLFFLFRDGEQISQGIARAIPLHPQHTRRLLTQFATVVRATVKGNIVVALVQGTLGALAFGVLGLTGAVLWGAVMALLSLLPAVGAAMVWGPVALYYFFTGAVVKGIGLALWGAVVIGLVDNVLRPILVGKDTRMPDFLVLVATLGGIVVFGLNGFVIGPVIAAVFLVSWEMLASARQQAMMPPL